VLPGPSAFVSPSGSFAESELSSPPQAPIVKHSPAAISTRVNARNFFMVLD
jgi:hypothetical protein